MRLLHTSDWHLGRSLYGKKRYDEFTAFLEWLIKVITSEEIDVLLIAGDIFDTGTPSNRAQELYYKFLQQVAASSCRLVVIIAGNHDSPTFLNAPKEILKILNIVIVSSITDSLEDEVIILNTRDYPEAIICAVPYLRDKDIRLAEAGETIDDKNAKLIEGIKKHYSEVCQLAEQKKVELKAPDIPIIAMGHLFTAGGKTTDGDGVRDLYIGSLNHIHIDLFPPSIDYFALGHLHIPQIVNKKNHIRYSGSPIPMGFGEANQEKQVVIVEFDKTTPSIKKLTVPIFQQLVQITGSIEDIINKIETLKLEESQAWLEIEYTGKSIIPNLRQQIDEAISDSQLDVRKLINRQIANSVNLSITNNQTLDDLSVEEVFEHCLDAHQIPIEEREEYILCYKEILTKLLEEDSNAE